MTADDPEATAGSSPTDRTSVTYNHSVYSHSQATHYDFLRLYCIQQHANHYYEVQYKTSKAQTKKHFKRVEDEILTNKKVNLSSLQAVEGYRVVRCWGSHIV
jgi:hypothetical protein